MKFNLRPRELWTFKYWLHLAVLTVVVFAILQIWQGGDMFNIKNILVSIPLIAIGDIIAHSILKMD